MNNPLVSIIIPTFNRAHLIGETLDSIIAQTYENWECIVVDDGSSDNTDGVLADYCLRDSRIQYHHRPEEHLPGGNGARNYGFKLSKGEFVNWFDSDDLMSDNRLKVLLSKFEENENFDFCISDFSFFDENGKLPVKNIYNSCKSHNAFNDFILKKTRIHTINPLFKKKFLVQKELFNPKTLRGQDFEFLACILHNYNKEYGRIDSKLVKIRKSNFGITNLYLKGDFNKFKSYFCVLRRILKLIDNDKTRKEYMDYYYKEILLAVRLKLYVLAYSELLFLFIFFISKPLYILQRIFQFNLVLMIQLSNGKLYYRLKTYFN